MPGAGSHFCSIAGLGSCSKTCSTHTGAMQVVASLPAFSLGFGAIQVLLQSDNTQKLENKGNFSFFPFADAVLANICW